MNRLINNTYEILDVVGKGGMSVVYKARHIRLNTIWAVKEVHKSTGENIDLLAETNILKRLNHKTLPRIIDIFEDDQNVYVVEDFVSGDTLQKIIDRDKVIDEGRVLEWFKTLSEVLVYLHGQTPHPIIYRDMKPANVMLQSDQTLKLIDFGIAREYKPENRTDTTVVGTRGYAAPEQYGMTQSDARTDIYSLGVTMYYMATGKSPFEPPYTFVPARQLNPRLSAGMEAILAKCVQNEPEERYQSAEELLDDLNHIEKYDEEFKRVKHVIKMRRILLVLLYVTGLSLIAGGYFLNRSEIQQRYLALVTQSSQQDYETSLNTLHEAQQLLPERNEAYEKEASVMYNAGKFSEVTELTERLEQSGVISMEENPEIYLIAASACYEQNDYEKASEYYQQLSQLNTAFSVQNRISYAICLGRMGNLDQARQIIQAISADADEAQIAYLEGEINYLEKSYKEAADQFARVIDSNANDDLIKRAYISLAETYRDSAKLSASDPAYISSSYSLMIETLEEAMNRFDLSSNAVLWEMLGQAYYSRGTLEKDNDRDDILKSADAYRRAVSLGVQKEYLYVNMFVAYQAIGDYTSAEKVLDEMKSVYPTSYKPYMYHSYLLIMSENLKPESDRNYHSAYDEYAKASELAGTSGSDEQMQQLKSLIDQLKDGGWLN